MKYIEPPSRRRQKIGPLPQRKSRMGIVFRIIFFILGLVILSMFFR